MWFVANQDIQPGQEVCISYLEHDVLCENVQRRNQMLTLDFKEVEDSTAPSMTADNGPLIPVVDSDVQNELMAMSPFERLDSIDQLMLQASGEEVPAGEEIGDDEMDEQGAEWFKCDMQNLRILKAITLDGLGKASDALKLWEECVQFTESSLPPNDESLVVMRAQAALCAWNANEEQRAKQHAMVALHVHNLLFGGGVSRFRRRYRNEFCLNLRPDNGSGSSGEGKAAHDILWPHQP